MKDMFKNEIFGTLEPPHGAIIKEGTSLPTSQDIYFASKWNELFERYSTARIFLERHKKKTGSIGSIELISLMCRKLWN